MIKLKNKYEWKKSSIYVMHVIEFCVDISCTF